MNIEQIKKIAQEAADSNAEKWYSRIEKKLQGELEKAAKDGYGHLPLTIKDRWTEELLTDKTLQDKLKAKMDDVGLKIEYNSYKDGLLAIIKWK